MRPRPRVLAPLALALALLGCKDDARVYRTAKASGPAPWAPEAGQAQAGREGAANAQAAELPQGHPPINGPMNGDSGPAGAAAPAGRLHWRRPPGWTELPASGMRLATFKTPGGAELSVVVLPGPAGGELGNVNRWRGQLGLGPWDAAGLSSASKRVAGPAGKSLLVAFSGEGGARMAAAILGRPGETWFFKLSGAEKAVAAAEPAFAAFLGSLHEAR